MNSNTMNERAVGQEGIEREDACKRDLEKEKRGGVSRGTCSAQKAIVY
jgi:hypothetical protein